MYLDEKLLEIKQSEKQQIEVEKKKQEIIEHLKKEEKTRKTVQEYKEELESGQVEIKGSQYTCEKRKFLNNSLELFILTDSIKNVKESDVALSVLYDELEMSVNVCKITEQMIITTAVEFQEKIRLQMKEQKLDYYPIDQDIIHQSDKMIYYASGMIPVSIGSIMSINFCFQQGREIIVGSITFLLLKKYQLENLAMAIIENINICNITI